VITADGLKKRKERLDQLARGFLLDSSRFIRNGSPLTSHEVVAYTAALGKAFQAVSDVSEVLAKALERVRDGEIT
jgi:hypothetical protein